MEAILAGVGLAMWGLLLRRVSCTADVLIFVWEFEL